MVLRARQRGHLPPELQGVFGYGDDQFGKVNTERDSGLRLSLVRLKGYLPIIRIKIWVSEYVIGSSRMVDFLSYRISAVKGCRVFTHSSVRAVVGTPYQIRDFRNQQCLFNNENDPLPRLAISLERNRGR